MVHLSPIPPQPQGHSEAMGGRGRLAPAVACSTAAADAAAAAAAVVAAAGVLLRRHVLRVYAVAPVAAGAGARGRGIGVALHGVGLAGDPCQRHVAEAQTQAL